MVYSSQYSFPVTDKLSLFMITTWRNVITNLKKCITTLKVYGEYRQWNIIDNAMPGGKELWLVIIPQIIMARKRHFVFRGFPPHNLCNEYVKIKYMRITRGFAYNQNVCMQYHSHHEHQRNCPSRTRMWDCIDSE